MHAHRRRTPPHPCSRIAWALAICLLAATPPARAALISELFVGTDEADTMPHAVELAALTPGQSYQLLVTDPAASVVLSTHAFVPHASTHLLKSRNWHDAPAWWNPAAHPSATIDDTLAIAGLRALLLLEGDTVLTHLPQPGADDLLLDYVILSPPWLSPTTLADEPALTMQPGWAALRPRDLEHNGWKPWLTGLQQDGRIAPDGGQYLPLTPGLPNPAIPEPATLPMLAAGVMLLLGRGLQQPRHGGNHAQ